MPGKIHCKDAKAVKKEQEDAREHDRHLYHCLEVESNSNKVKERFHRKPYGRIGECFNHGV